MDLSVNVKTYEPSISGAVAENELNNPVPSDCAKKYQHSREKKSTGKKNGFTSRTIAPRFQRLLMDPQISKENGFILLLMNLKYPSCSIGSKT